MVIGTHVGEVQIIANAQRNDMVDILNRIGAPLAHVPNSIIQLANLGTRGMHSNANRDLLRFVGGPRHANCRNDPNPHQGHQTTKH